MKTTNHFLAAAMIISLWFGLAGPASGFYDPSIQRWINRDPLADTSIAHAHDCALQSQGSERGASSAAALRANAEAYVFAENGPMNRIDANGLVSLGWCQYFCVRYGTLGPYYICVRMRQFNCRCPYCTSFYVAGGDLLPFTFLITPPCLSDGSGPDWSVYGDHDPA